MTEEEHLHSDEPLLVRARAEGIAVTGQTVRLSLTGCYASASLLERVWTVARFPRWDWRVFLLLQ